MYISSILLTIHLAAAAAAAVVNSYPRSLKMLDSIISREQGITTDAAVKTSVIEAGLLMMGIDSVLDGVGMDRSREVKYQSYFERVVSGLIPVLANGTADARSPLDEFGVGSGFLRRYLKTGNETLVQTIETLHQADNLRLRQDDGSYLYYTYANVTTLDGLFSIPSFHSIYARSFDPQNALQAYQTSLLQFSNIIKRCRSTSTGLLYHGYDPTRSYPIWGNLTARGHSQSIWARAVGWACVGLLETLDVIPDIPATTGMRNELRDIFAQLMDAIVRAQDSASGAWWQVIDSPAREGNFLESSATGLFTYSLFRGLRLGYLGKEEEDQKGALEGYSEKWYRDSAERAYQWLLENAVVELGDGTLGYDRTVDVCSINSTTAFEFYVTQPIKKQSLLGEAGFLLADVERGLYKKR